MKGYAFFNTTPHGGGLRIRDHRPNLGHVEAGQPDRRINLSGQQHWRRSWTGAIRTPSRRAAAACAGQAWRLERTTPCIPSRHIRRDCRHTVSHGWGPSTALGTESPPHHRAISLKHKITPPGSVRLATTSTRIRHNRDASASSASASFPFRNQQVNRWWHNEWRHRSTSGGLRGGE